MVPLPEPEGPSMVSDRDFGHGATWIPRPECRARSTNPGKEVSTLAQSSMWISPSPRNAAMAKDMAMR